MLRGFIYGVADKDKKKGFYEMDLSEFGPNLRSYCGIIFSDTARTMQPAYFHKTEQGKVIVKFCHPKCTKFIYDSKRFPIYPNFSRDDEKISMMCCRGPSLVAQTGT
jgi:hypothetical protein